VRVAVHESRCHHQGEDAGAFETRCDDDGQTKQYDGGDDGEFDGRERSARESKRPADGHSRKEGDRKQPCSSCGDEHCDHADRDHREQVVGAGEWVQCAVGKAVRRSADVRTGWRGAERYRE
jgi:hypothetical protein